MFLFRKAVIKIAAGQIRHQTSDVKKRVKCTLIPGDGASPELMAAVQQVFKAASIPVDFETILLSELTPETSASVEKVVASINKNKVCLKGIVTISKEFHGELQSLNMKLRKGLDVFANVVHIRSVPGIPTRHKNIDFFIVREYTEGEYSSLEHESIPGVVECLKIITRTKSRRIAQFAFDFAARNKRTQVTCIHKANIMKLSDGLFLKCCGDIAKLYPRIEFGNMIVDNATMQLISNPEQFDVLVMPNLYGNIIDNLGSGLVGGAGIVASESYSRDCVIFEPGAKHSFAKGKTIANPTAMFFCAIKMLHHVNRTSYAKMMNKALITVLVDGKVRTQDLGGHANTQQFTDAVIDNLQTCQ